MNVRIGSINLDLSLIGTFLGILVYGLLLDVIYVKFLSPLYSYSGFVDNSNLQLFILSVILLIGSIFFIVPIIEEKEDRISSLIIILLYFLSFVPFTTCVFVGMYVFEFIVLHMIYWLWLFYLRKYFLKKPRGFNLGLGSTERFRQRIFYFIILSLAMVVMYISYRYTGFRMNFSLLNVYDLRAEAKEYSLPALLSYLLSWTSTVNPFVVGYAFLTRRYFLMASVLFVQFLNFGIGGHKSVLMMPYFVIAMLWYFRDTSLRSIKRKIVWIFNSVSILSIFEICVCGTSNVLAILVRRIFFVPAYLNRAYFEFFSTNEPDYFFGGFLRHFGFETKYIDGIARTIGAYLDHAEMNANNGLFSDAFATLGYIGLFVMPMLIVMMLKITDNVMIKFPVGLYLVLALPVSAGLLSTSLFTVLNTHGWLAGLIIASVTDLNESS